MRRIRVAAVIAALLLAGPLAHADQQWQANQRAQGFQLDGLHNPATSKDPATAPLLYGGHLQLSLPCNATGSTGVFSDCTLDTTLRWNAGQLGIATAPGLSILGTASTSSGAPSAVTATGGSQFYGTNAAGTAASFSAVPAAATSGIVANWPIASPRWYCVSASGGNDSNVGYSDTSSADCGTKAKATLAGLAAIFPRQCNGRMPVVVINQGTYTDPLDIFLQGVIGCAANFPMVVATGTNSTAGATAFAGDANDRLYVGAVTATGANAGGYNPKGTPTQTTVQMQLNGGGIASFGAEPGLPLGARLRFASTTSTAPLQNVSVAIIGVTTTTTTNDTLLLPSPATGAGGLPATPSTSDVAYVEMPGVTVGTCNLTIGGNANGPGGITSQNSPTFVGLNVSTNTRLSGGRTYWAFSRHAAFSTVDADITQTSFSYKDETGTIRQVGPTRSDGASGPTGVYGINTNNANAPFFSAGAYIMNGSILGTLSNGSYVAGLGLFNVAFGIDSGSNQPQGSIGARTVNSQSTLRIVGTVTVQAKTAGISMQASSVPLEKIQITGVGANPAIAMQGKSAISVTSGLTGSSGNSDVGLDLTDAADSRILIYSTPTVTGSNGDVRLCDRTIISWATAAAGRFDNCGNVLYGPGTYPTFLIDPGSNGLLARTTTGTATPRTLTTSTLILTNPDGVAGNPSIDLPALSGIPAPTGTGFAPVVGGVWGASARAVDLSNSDIINQLKAASFPALTGPVTTPGGSLATTLNLGAGGITGQLPLADLAQGGASTSNLLAWSGTAWAPTAAPTSLPPSGSAGHDLGGTYPNPNVVGLFDGTTDHPIDALTGGQCLAIDATTGHTKTVACSAGGTVTGVSGTSGRITVSPSSPNPVVDLATFGTASTCAWANVVTDAWGRATCTANAAPQAAGNYITALTGDGTATGPGSVAFTLNNIPTATSSAGYVNITETAAPATPAAGHVDFFADSTFHNGAFKNPSGTVSYGAQVDAGATHHFLTSFAATGAFTDAQPVEGDIVNLTTDLAGKQATITWPAAGDALISAGTSSVPVGDPNFKYDTSNHTLVLGGGTAAPSQALNVAAGTSFFTYNNPTGFASGGPYLLQFDNTNGGTGQTVMTWSHSGVVDAALNEAIGIFYMYAPGSQGFQVLNSATNSTPLFSVGGTGILAYGQGSGLGVGSIASHSALDIMGSTSGIAVYLGQASATQTIDKHGGDLGIEVDDAHAINFATNSAVRATIDSSGGYTIDSLGTGIVKSTSGLLGNASSSDITGAISWPTGILAGDSSALTTVTLGFTSTTTGLGYSGTTLGGVAFVGSGSSHAQGMVPDPPSSAGVFPFKYLREDATWHTVNFAGSTVTYYMNGIANSTLFTGGFLQPGTSGSISSLHIESPIEYAVEKIRLVLNVILNNISAGQVTCTITKNALATAATVTFGAGATGVFDSGLTSTVSAAAGDTYGVDCSSSSALATGSTTAVVSMYLY